MSKIKIELAGGSVIEKPLITCFKGSNSNYIVFDNETNGSMGLPIICISKFNGTSVEKIFDGGEWTSVKENLKTIISGNNLPYLSVPDVLNAQDDFFTQLTLPVASFDLLKNVYKPPVDITPALEIQEPAEVPTEIMDPLSTVQAEVDKEELTVGTEKVIPLEPAAITLDSPKENIIANPVESAPLESVSLEIPKAPDEVPVEDPIEAPSEIKEEAPVIDSPVVSQTEEPKAEEVHTSLSEESIDQIKENFMKSCETMFDALIKKFEK